MKREELKFVSKWATLLWMSENRIQDIAWEMPDADRYKQFAISKSNGGLRIISEPIRELKNAQGHLMRVFERAYKPLSCSHGFVSGKSILTNARNHVRKPWVLNLDIKKFFPSIKIERVNKAISELEFIFTIESDNDRYNCSVERILLEPQIVSLISNLCCFRSLSESEDPETLHGLPQGAPTSPILSDMVARKMDEDLLAYCEDRGIEYSRYADDLSFSPHSQKDSHAFKELIGSSSFKRPVPSGKLLEIIQDNGFRINSKKTKLFRGKSSKQVTGLTVNEFANVPRKLIRSIRQELYLWEKYGYQQATDIIHQRKNYRHKKCPKTLKYLIHGKLLFLSMVRGKGDPTYMRFVRRFKMLEKRDVISSTREAYVCKWEDPEDFWDNKGEEWKFLNSESQMRFKIILDDFPRRSGKHFAGRLEIFLKAGNDLRKKLRTEIGSFCFERLNHIFDIRGGLLEQFTYDRLGTDARCMLDYLLDAEATYLHFLHEDRVERRAHEKFAELFFRVMSVNAEVCSEKLLDPAFEAHLRHIDWGTFFRHQNEEFLARRYGYQKMDAAELVQIAADVERRAMPCASLMLWTALAPMALNAKDEGLASHRDLYRKTLEKYPQFYPIFDDVFTSCTRVRDGRSASLTVSSLRRGVYMLIRALAKRPAGVPVT